MSSAPDQCSDDVLEAETVSPYCDGDGMEDRACRRARRDLCPVETKRIFETWQSVLPRRSYDADESYLELDETSPPATDAGDDQDASESNCEAIEQTTSEGSQGTTTVGQRRILSDIVTRAIQRFSAVHANGDDREQKQKKLPNVLRRPFRAKSTSALPTANSLGKSKGDPVPPSPVQPQTAALVCPPRPPRPPPLYDDCGELFFASSDDDPLEESFSVDAVDCTEQSTLETPSLQSEVNAFPPRVHEMQEVPEDVDDCDTPRASIATLRQSRPIPWYYSQDFSIHEEDCCIFLKLVDDEDDL